MEPQSIRSSVQNLTTVRN